MRKGDCNGAIDDLPTNVSGNFSRYIPSMSTVFPTRSLEKRSSITAPGSPRPWFVFTQLSWYVCVFPEYGDPMEDEGALAIDGPEGAWGSDCDVGTEGGVGGIDGKLEAF